MQPRKLLVLLNYRLSDLIRKGEITLRYYNPGNLFDEVHILITRPDYPEIEKLQKAVGKAMLYIHTIPPPNPILTLGFRPALLKMWARRGIGIARKIRPNLMRVHGDNFNGFLAYCIKSELGVPYVMSYHHNPYQKVPKEWQPHRDLALWLLRDARKLAVRNADCAVPVYQSIIPYLRDMGAQRIQVAYNVVAPEKIQIKKVYGLHDPVRLIYVGRLLRRKNPENIIRAMQQLPEATLHIVGDGPLLGVLKELAKELRITPRITFTPAMPNKQLCQILAQQDIFVLHIDSHGISKTIIEAFLSGLPVVVNRRKGEQVEELRPDFVKFAENTPESYAVAIKELIAKPSERKRLGKQGRSRAIALWEPKKTEQKYVQIYKKYALNESSNSSLK
ncbi:MAG: glycosyltransferase [Anaerolineales bacterium]